MLGAMQIAASAATQKQDGIEAELTAGVSGGNAVNAQLKLSNTNKFDLENIGIEYEVPAGYSIGSSRSSVALLKGGESVSLNVQYDSLNAEPETTTAQQTQTTAQQSTAASSSQSTAASTSRQNASSTKTGDDFPLALLAGIALASGAAACICIRKKGGKKMLSLILCAAICGSAAGNLNVLRSNAAEQGAERSFTVTETVLNGSEEIRISVTITYQYPDGETETENISFKLDDTMYDSKTDTYYLFDEKKMLSGLIRNHDHIASVSYSITDRNDKELMGGKLEPSESWKIENLGLIVGENTVTVTVQYEDETAESETVTINNLCEKNMDPLNVDKRDTDNDGVLNFIEELYHTDPDRPDTDADRLSDYDEMAVFGTDPTLKDTDKNGVTDDLEDHDNDQLTNYEEIYEYETDPLAVDSDNDELTDYEELKEHHTDPNESDTDQDGAADGWEIQNGFDPAVKNDDFGDADPFGQSSDTVVMEDGTEVTPVLDDGIFNETMQGYLGMPPFNVDLKDNESTTLKIPYDKNKVEEDDTVTFYVVDWLTQQVRPIPTEISPDGIATARITENGMYILLSRRDLADVWKNDIRPASESGWADGNMDVVFVIDRSASMNENDPMNVRKEVVKRFINKLRPLDRAAIVQFTAVAETIIRLTDNKEALGNAVDGIQNSDGGGGCINTDKTAGTNGAAGIRNALDALQNSNAANKLIVFLTDGADTTTPENYTYADLEEEAKGNVKIHTIGLVGEGSVNTDLLKEIADATGGNYYLATLSDEQRPEIEPEQLENPEKMLNLEDVYSDIESMTIDRANDSNGDGITDYYTRLLCDGRIVTTTGRRVFGNASYDDVQNVMHDYDGDGLRNDEEIEIVETDEGVYVKVHSYPDTDDSDGDHLSDFREKNDYGTSPLKKNRYVYQDDVNWAVHNENFVANKFVRMYEDSILKYPMHQNVLIGNIFYGTSYSMTTLYEFALLDYFDQINQTMYDQIWFDISCMQTKDLFMAALLETKKDFDAVVKSDTEKAEKLRTINDFLTKLCDLAGITVSAVQSEREVHGLTEEALKQTISNLERYIATHDGEWVHLEQSATESFEEFERYRHTLAAECKAYKDELGYAYDGLRTTSNVNAAAEHLDKVGIMLTVALAMKHGVDNITAYNEMISKLEVIRENVYILDSVIAGTDNRHLKRAASNIKDDLNSQYTTNSQKIMNFLAGSSYEIDAFETLIGESIHVKIGQLGEVGAAIELARTFGNTVFNASDVAQATSKLYAITKTSNIVAARYNEYLNAGNAVGSNGIWVFYSDNSDAGVQRMVNLLSARSAAEKQMITRNEAHSFLTEWLFKDKLYPNDKCDENIAECQHLINMY